MFHRLRLDVADRNRSGTIFVADRVFVYTISMLSATSIGMISIRNKKQNDFAPIANPQRINSAFRNIVGFCIFNFTLSMLSNDFGKSRRQIIKEDFAVQISMQSLINLFIHFVRINRPIRNEIETYRIGYPQRLNAV